MKKNQFQMKTPNVHHDIIVVMGVANMLGSDKLNQFQSHILETIEFSL